MIFWRIKSANHVLLSRLAYACFGWVLLGASVETAITIWLLNRSWHRWSISFKVLLPIVFTLWITTQLYGATRIFSMARSKQRLAMGLGDNDGESGVSRDDVNDTKQDNKLAGPSRSDANRSGSFQLEGSMTSQTELQRP